MFAAAYFPNAYFPKTYFPECTVAGVVVETPGTFSNSKRRRRVPTVAELLRKDREEAQLKARQKYDGKYLPVAVVPTPSVYAELSEKSQRLIAELNSLAPQQEAEAIRSRLQEIARRLFLLGLFGG